MPPTQYERTVRCIDEVMRYLLCMVRYGKVRYGIVLYCTVPYLYRTVLYIYRTVRYGTVLKT